MKEAIAISILCMLLVLSYAGARGTSHVSEAVVQCPSLDQLLAEKAAKEKQDRADRAKERRDKIVEELRKWIDP